MPEQLASMPQYRRMADSLKMAGDPSRLAILVRLQEGEANVTELTQHLGLASQPAVSHHLALLRAGRLVDYRRQGKSNFYALTERGRVLANAAQSVAE